MRISALYLKYEVNVMLKKFEVEGFKSFDYKLSIDFSDVKQYSFNRECVLDGLLKTIIVYGKNAVGKTNLGLALFDIVTHLVDRNVSPNLYDYYLNNQGKYQYATFRYVFQFGEDEVDYKYKKSDVDNIQFESLSINEVLYFEYTVDSTLNNVNAKSFDKFAINELLPNLNYDYNDASSSSLRYIVNNSAIDKDHPIRKMYDFVSNMLWFRSLDEHRFIGYKDSVKKANDYHDFIFEGTNLQDFQSLLKSSGINDKLVVRSTPEKEKVLYFDGKSLIPFFKAASNGTKALYAYFYWTRNKTVSFLFIDEFDAYYHYELSEMIVKNLEERANQTVLTSHNTNLLSNSIMRPDCYFILTPTKITSIARATSRELREGHNLEKLYMNGEFDES